jgi:hypothetical protein
MRITTLIAILAATVTLAGCNDRSGEVGAKGEPGIAGPAGPAGPAGISGSSIRTVTSEGCSSNGCPTSCEADETLISVICVGATSAKFSDNMQVENGALTARCGPSTTRAIGTCARK